MLINRVEPELSNILTFRQTLGYAVLENTKSNQVDHKTRLVERIENLLLPLLPIREAIRPGLIKLIDMAVDLSNDMLMEKAWFRCRMIRAGRAYDENLMEAEETQEGRVYLCTFPLFIKVVRDGEEEGRCFVKANVELESMFRSSRDEGSE